MSSPSEAGPSGCDHLPHREGDVLDPVAGLGTAGAAELGHARSGRVEADHAFEVGNRDEQGAVGVAVAEYRVDLEDGPARITGIDAGAVVDDPLEDRKRSQPHATMLADAEP
jgi:hypothetical protein